MKTTIGYQLSVIICVLFFVNCLLFTAHSQDLIVKRDSSVIFCKISKVDSATIYYRQKKGEQTMELSILRTDIVSFYKKNAAVLSEIARADTLVKVQPKNDTIKMQGDSLKKNSRHRKTKNGFYKSKNNYKN